MAKDFNQPQIVEHYDQHIRKLIPGYELVHQQVQALLQLHLKGKNAHILVVGCGTGQELIQLASHFTNWQFTAIDCAIHMIQKVEQRIEKSKLSNKINLICADTSMLSMHLREFDAALSILVAHFVEDKFAFYQDIYESLKPNGLCVSYDLMQLQQGDDLRLKYLAEITGLHPKQSQLMCERLEKDFQLVSVGHMQKLYSDVGFKSSEIFCQIFNYHGVLALK